MASNRNEKKGRGWRGDKEGHKMAGQRGGMATLSRYGDEFFREIGSKGGEVSTGNFANDPQRAREAGRKGGKMRALKSKVKDLTDIAA